MFARCSSSRTVFGVSILASEQEALSRRFAAEDSTHRFDGIGYRARRERRGAARRRARAHRVPHRGGARRGRSHDLRRRGGARDGGRRAAAAVLSRRLRAARAIARCSSPTPAATRLRASSTIRRPTPPLRERSLRDVRARNTLLGGTRAVLSELGRLLPVARHATARCSTSAPDWPTSPSRARRLRAKRGACALTVFGVDQAESLARLAARVLDGSACADARCLPFADASVDVVICSQLLHHFEDAEIPTRAARAGSRGARSR